MKLLSLLLFLFTACQRPNYTQISSPFEVDYKINRFEKTILGYEKQDSLQMPEKGGIVLAGSSSFFFWKTVQQDLAPLPIINHGFGGSTFPEVTHYLNRTVIKYQPKTVVVYCENDLYGTKPKTPEQMRDAYVNLCQELRKSLPKTAIYFVSLIPSPLRWKQWGDASRVNSLIQEFIKTDKRHHYVDITAVMLKNGKPDGSIFLSDSLHMNAEGYRRWTSVLKPILSKK